MAELRGLGAINAELQQMGVRLVAISIDTPEESAGVVAKQKLPFSILSDREHKTISEYGLVHGHGGGERDIAIPATIIVDRDGKIVWRHIAARVTDRPEASEVLRAARSSLGSSSR